VRSLAAASAAPAADAAGPGVPGGANTVTCRWAKWMPASSNACLIRLVRLAADHELLARPRGEFRLDQHGAVLHREDTLRLERLDDVGAHVRVRELLADPLDDLFTVAMSVS
jgi:hypothetical protein